MLTLNKVLKAIPTTDELVSYTNALLLINQYTYAISCQKMPNLANPPQRYSNYIKQFQSAQKNPCKWTQTYFGLMASTPASIIKYPNPFGVLENHLIRLINNPNDRDAKISLKKDFDNIHIIFKMEDDSIQDIFKFLTDFVNSIGNDAATLNRLSNEALNLSDYDKNKILNLKCEIENLQERIEKDEQFLKASDLIGKLVNLCISVVGIECEVATEIVLKELDIIIDITHFGTPDSILGTLAQEDIKQAQQKIKSDAAEIKAVDADVVLLTNLSAQFSKLDSALPQTNDALRKILNMWKVLSQAIALVKSELEVVEWNDLKSGHYQAALDDLYKIKSNWGELYNSANTLSNVSFTWQDTDGNWHNFGEQNPSQNNSKVNYIQAN